MKDRTPQYPGRVQLRHVRDDLYDLTRADEAVEAGTPLNKSTLLTDETAAALGLDPAADPTVNDALLQTLANVAAMAATIPSDPEIQKLIDSAVVAHNQATAAHSDIRSSISSVQGTLQGNIDKVDSTLTGDVNNIRSTLTSVQNNINSVNTTLSANINNVNSTLTGKINSVNSDLLARINATNGTINGLTKFELGTYIGSSKYGAKNPNSLSFGFVPKIVLILSLQLLKSATGSDIAQVEFSMTVSNLLYSPKLHMSHATGSTSPAVINFYDGGAKKAYAAWANSGKTITWYATTNASDQFNNAHNKYGYIAIG